MPRRVEKEAWGKKAETNAVPCRDLRGATAGVWPFSGHVLTVCVALVYPALIDSSPWPCGPTSRTCNANANTNPNRLRNMNIHNIGV